jgi:GxxExxY protein
VYLHQELTHKIIAAAIEVHKNLGPGLWEAVYQLCLELELKKQGLQYQKEVMVPLSYKSEKINHFLRLDFLVENEVVLELKSIEMILPVHEAQLLTYLRFSGKEIGLLINFNVPVLKQGIRRCILSAHEASHSSSLKVGVP